MEKLAYIEEIRNYIKLLEELKETNPKLAKALAVEGLVRTGIIDSDENLCAPYNGMCVSDEFTRGPKYDLECESPLTVIELVGEINSAKPKVKNMKK